MAVNESVVPFKIAVAFRAIILALHTVASGSGSDEFPTFFSTQNTTGFSNESVIPVHVACVIPNGKGESVNPAESEARVSKEHDEDCVFPETIPVVVL